MDVLLSVMVTVVVRMGVSSCLLVLPHESVSECFMFLSGSVYM